MDEVTTKITDTFSNAVKSVVEITKERIFTPMYFYFLGSWIIANWKFVYSMFFTDEETILRTHQMLKVEYLLGLYSAEWFLPLWYSALKLFIIPAIFSFVIIWWLSILSEMFFRKYEEHQMNKRVIKRDIEYREKVHYAKSERVIREQELDNRIKYENNSNFNESLDERYSSVTIGKTVMSPSEVLYNTDYKAYVEALNDYEGYMAQMGEDIAFQQEYDKRRGK